MNEVVIQSGLNKHSLYKEFGDKEGLFLACLEHYVNESTKEIGEILTKKPIGLKNIEAFFDNRVKYAASKTCKGCLLANSVIEKELINKKINRRIKQMLTMHGELIFDCLTAAQEKGEISKDKDCNVLQKYLSCFLRGLMNIGKNETNEEKLRNITNVAISAIRN